MIPLGKHDNSWGCKKAVIINWLITIKNKRVLGVKYPSVAICSIIPTNTIIITKAYIIVITSAAISYKNIN